MPAISKTGLLPCANIFEKVEKPQVTTFELPKFSSPAPYVLRPFAGVYNPFPYGCSVLCNHPADYEAKDVVRKAKETWALDGRSIACEGQVSLRSQRQSRCGSHGGRGRGPTDAVPEELFRKYTDTDSRPITPAPTLASIITRSSQVRRCMTPDAVSSQPGRERTLLVLDLRRSQSQETLNWIGGQVPSTVLQPPTRTPSRSASSLGTSSPPLGRKKKLQKGKNSASLGREDLGQDQNADAEASLKLKQQVLTSVKTLAVAETGGDGLLTDRSGVSSGDEAMVKRRGKKKKGKKSGRDNGKEGEREFQGIPDPGETQVSALGESRGGSTRPSLTPGIALETAEPSLTAATPSAPTSFLPTDLLRQLQRQLEQEDVESEFDTRRKIALEEALRTRPPPKFRHQGEELKALKKELRLPENINKWLSVPRVFSRRSVRFELPMDSRLLGGMSNLDYASCCVFPSSERLVLYNQVFNLHREEFDEDEQMERTLLGKNIVECLHQVMGRILTPNEATDLQTLLGLTEQSTLDFRTFSGIAALCERLLGTPPPREIDPPTTLEQADFRCLDRVLSRLDETSPLRGLLKAIKYS